MLDFKIQPAYAIPADQNPFLTVTLTYNTLHLNIRFHCQRLRLHYRV